MNRYKCKKCGETMTSKDPVRRNVFPSDMTAAIMTNITNVITTRKDNGQRQVTIEFPFSDTDESWSDDELEIQCVQNLRGLTDDNVRHWLCNHKWKKTSGDYVVPEML